MQILEAERREQNGNTCNEIEKEKYEI